MLLKTGWRRKRRGKTMKSTTWSEFTGIEIWLPLSVHVIVFYFYYHFKQLYIIRGLQDYIAIIVVIEIPCIWIEGKLYICMKIMSTLQRMRKNNYLDNQTRDFMSKLMLNRNMTKLLISKINYIRSVGYYQDTVSDEPRTFPILRNKYFK